MKKLVRIAGLTALAFSLSSGVAAAATGTIDDTGWWSFNKAYVSDEHKTTVDNDADVDFDSDVDQDADSGNALVFGWTADGDAESGAAGNTAKLEGSVAVDQSAAAENTDDDCGCVGNSAGTVKNTGYKSYNKVVSRSSSYTRVENDVDIDVDSDVDQDADSGNATVKGGDGSATSGAATNSSSTTLNISVTQ